MMILNSGLLFWGHPVEEMTILAVVAAMFLSAAGTTSS